MASRAEPTFRPFPFPPQFTTPRDQAPVRHGPHARTARRLAEAHPRAGDPGEGARARPAGVVVVEPNRTPSADGRLTTPFHLHTTPVSFSCNRTLACSQHSLHSTVDTSIMILYALATEPCLGRAISRSLDPFPGADRSSDVSTSTSRRQPPRKQ